MKKSIAAAAFLLTSTTAAYAAAPEAMHADFPAANR